MAVTAPKLVTDAIPKLVEDQGVVASGVPVPTNIVFEPSQRELTPEIVGNGFTVTVTVFEGTSKQSPFLTTALK